MFRTTSFAAILLGGALAALPAFSQEGGRSDATVQAFGSFVKTTTDNGVQQGATNSGGVLASYRYFFSNHHGVEVNYGYSLNTQTYGLAAGPLGVKSNQHEVTAAYVYRHALRHFTPFVEAGVGGLVFSPTSKGQLLCLCPQRQGTGVRVPGRGRGREVNPWLEGRHESV